MEKSALPVLPHGYEFADQDSITGEQITTLRGNEDWGATTTEAGWDRILDTSLATVGVRDAGGELVGIGFLIGNERNAILCDLNVHPQHRHQGIARAIVKRRVQIVDESGIPHAYTQLAPTNPLHSLYEELGFVAGGMTLSRGCRYT